MCANPVFLLTISLCIFLPACSVRLSSWTPCLAVHVVCQWIHMQLSRLHWQLDKQTSHLEPSHSPSSLSLSPSSTSISSVPSLSLVYRVEESANCWTYPSSCCHITVISKHFMLETGLHIVLDLSGFQQPVVRKRMRENMTDLAGLSITLLRCG